MRHPTRPLSSPARNRRILAATFLAATALLAPRWLSAFTVTKNVNSGKPPVEKVVIFEKGKPADHLIFDCTDNGKTQINADGAIESRIVGSDAMKIAIRWKPQGNLKESFNADDYGSLLLTCRLEGNVKTTQPNGKVAEQRPDNLWLPVVFFNAKGEAVASANLADATDNNRTPDTMTTLRIPMVLMTFWGHDTQDIRAIGFTWSKGRPTSQRDFRLIIEKIALAD